MPGTLVPSADDGRRLAAYIINTALTGVGPVKGADSLAQEYLDDPAFTTNDERVDALIRWEVSKNFGVGFVTGFGGFLSLPVTIPADIGASYVLQARMVAAIARIYGHDLGSDRVQTAILMTLLGTGMNEILKDVGVKVAERGVANLIRRIPGRVLAEINKKVGMRLLTKAGEKGIINLTKMVPLAGALVGGAMDGAAAYTIGKTAKTIFRREGEEVPGVTE